MLLKGLAALVGLVAGPAAATLPPPVPPCAGAPVPAYASLAAPPAVALWRDADLPAGWQPPACTGMRGAPPALYVALAARFEEPGGTAALLERMARISGLREVRYWSASRQRWQPMLNDAQALAAADARATRPDFTVDEVTSRREVHFVEDQSDLLGPVVQRLTLRELTPDRLVLEVANASPVRIAFIQVLPPGGSASLFTIERESGNVWRYYTLTRVETAGFGSFGPPDASYVNRADAIFRWVAGQPTEHDAPLAPD